MSGGTVSEIVREAALHLDDVDRDIVHANLLTAWQALTMAVWHMRRAVPLETVRLANAHATDLLEAAQAVAPGRREP